MADVCDLRHSARAGHVPVSDGAGRDAQQRPRGAEHLGAVPGARARVPDEHVPRLCAGHEQHEADHCLTDP